MQNHVANELLLPAKKAKLETSIAYTEDSQYAKIFKHAKVILLDIEGTTTPVSFVAETLFPYAKSNVKSYLSDNYSSDVTIAIIKSLQELSKIDAKENKFNLSSADLNENKEIVIDAVVEYVTWLIEMDKKVTPLKQLQGYIWKSAYESGKIKGEFFEDVQDALELWKKDGKLIYIYSSGSVQAQKLLFQYSVNGDLLSFIEGHFDTKIGNKRDKNSYIKIAEELDINSKNILFLTDVTAEADAALAAGMSTFILCRPGNKPINDKSKYVCIDDFTCLKS